MQFFRHYYDLLSLTQKKLAHVTNTAELKRKKETNKIICFSDSNVIVPDEIWYQKNTAKPVGVYDIFQASAGVRVWFEGAHPSFSTLNDVRFYDLYFSGRGNATAHL